MSYTNLRQIVSSSTEDNNQAVLRHAAIHRDGKERHDGYGDSEQKNSEPTNDGDKYDTIFNTFKNEIKKTDEADVDEDYR